MSKMRTRFYSIIKKIAVIFIFFLITQNLFAQKVSEQQDIAIFKLSYKTWTIPEILLENIDEEILTCFYSLKRFNIIAMQHRISSMDLNSFNANIKLSREKNAIIPEKVLMGQEAFTKSDWEKIVNSYFIVVPIITNWELEIKTENDTLLQQTRKEYKGSFSIRFHIYSMKNENKEIARFLLEDQTISMVKTIYYDKYGRKVKEDFSKTGCSVGFMLERNLRDVEEFIIKSGIIKTENSNFYFELGENLGIKKGDEYIVIGYDENNTEKETGFAVVTDTKEDFSKALTLFKSQNIVIGDQIKEVPRLPVEFRIFVTPEFSILKGTKGKPAFSTGIHISQTRGFYRIRPCYSTEVIFLPEVNILTGVPVSFALGLEVWNTYIGRLQLLPTIEGFFTGIASAAKSDQEKFIPAEAGGKIFLHLSWLITRDIKIGGDIGLKAGMNFLQTSSDALIMRILIGAGVTIKL